MDLCDLHEDCDGGDDEYNDICGESERNILYFLPFETFTSLLIVFCNFHYHGHHDRVLWREVSHVCDRKLHFTNCLFVS